MDEKEKCERGLLYDPNDAKLLEERTRCKVALYELEKLSPRKTQKRREGLSSLLGSTQGDFTIESGFKCDYGYNIHVGENFFANFNLVILDEAKVEFGHNVLIGPNCSFYTALHPFEVESRNQGLETAKPIKVGSNVWLGGNVVVLPGVEIGDNCIIGAGSVISRSIEEGMLAVGNPCKAVRKIN